MRVVVLGHPRSGTGYTAHCFRQSGWAVGHESRRRDGIASWMWAVPGWHVPWGEARGDEPLPGIILHVLRDPAACVSSVAFTEQFSEEWRAEYVAIPPNSGNHVERAVWSLYGWSRLIAKLNPTHTAQLEQVERAVEEITGKAPAAPSVMWFNTRDHRRLSADEIKATHWVQPKTAILWDRINADYAEAAS